MSVSTLLNEMDPKGRQMMDRGRLLELERDLQDEKILYICRSSFPFGTLVVTPQRLIVLLQDGGVDVTPFAEVSGFDLIEGTKKLLGGYSPTYLNTQLRNGVRVSGQRLGGGPWAIRCGKRIIAAHEGYTIHGSPTVSPPTQSQPHHGGASAPRSGPAPRARSASAPASDPVRAIFCNNPKCDAFGLKTPLAYCDMCGAPTGVEPLVGARRASVTLDTWSRVCNSSDCDALGIPTNQSVCDICGRETVPG